MQHKDRVLELRDIDHAERPLIITYPKLVAAGANRGIGLKSAGSRPDWTMYSSYPALRRAASGNAPKSWRAVPAKHAAFISWRLYDHSYESQTAPAELSTAALADGAAAWVVDYVAEALAYEGLLAVDV